MKDHNEKVCPKIGLGSRLSLREPYGGGVTSGLLYSDATLRSTSIAQDVHFQRSLLQDGVRKDSPDIENGHGQTCGRIVSKYE